MSEETPEKRSSYRGDFHFVNCEPGNLRPPRNRRPVYSHVQREYHRWRRREDARQLRLVNFGPHRLRQTLATVGSVDGTTDEDCRNAIGAPAIERVASTFTDTSSSSGSVVESIHPGYKNSFLLPFRSASPLSPLQRGNSDPFSSSAVTIDARANDIILFARECFIPSQFAVSADKMQLSSAALKNWHDFLQDLRDPGSATAMLSIYATGAAIVTGDSFYEQRAISYRIQSSKFLRERLTLELRRPSALLYAHLRRAFASEVVAQDSTAARVHGNMLATLLRHDAERDALDPLLLGFFLWHDMALATTQMSRPVLDVEHWVPAIFEEVDINKKCRVLFQQHPDQILDPMDLANLTLPPLQVDASIQSTRLQRLLKIAHQHLAKWRIAKSDPEVGTQYVLNLFYIHGYVLQGQLVNQYLDLVEEVATASKGAMRDLLMYAAVTVSAIYCIRSIRTDVFVCGIPFYYATPTILFHLKETLQQSMEVCEPKASHQGAHLWCLLVGALAERALHQQTKAVEADDSWFRKRLAVHIRVLGLQSWDSVRQRLQGLPTLEGVLPERPDMRF